MSKLAQLAKMRSSKADSEIGSTKTPKLLDLAKSRRSIPKDNVPSESTENKSLAILRNLRTKLDSKSDTTKSPVRIPPGLNRIKNIRNKETTLNSLPERLNDDKNDDNKQRNTKSPVEHDKPLAENKFQNMTLNSILSEPILDASNLLHKPITSVSMFLFDRKRQHVDCLELTTAENRTKRNRHNEDLFYQITNIDFNPELIEKAKKTFHEPSPDDLIIEAQKNAFEENMGGLKISEDIAQKAPISSEQKPPTKTKPFKKIDFPSLITKNKELLKPHKSFVVIGHVDAGKSTLMGRILFDLGAVDAKTIHKLTRESEKSGKGSFALAWVMDQTTEERNRGVTVDICTTSFETQKCRFTAIDAPGHKDFVPQMISGVSQADFALLVADSITGEFEAGFALDGQTKEHAIIARSIGIQKLCVLVNKMDKEEWSEVRFSEIRNQLQDYLTSDEIGFNADQIEFIPISGLTGYNVVKNDHSISEFEWYTGPTLLEYLDNIEILGQSLDGRKLDQLEKDDFNFSINDVFDISNNEFGVIGKVNSGIVQAGETITILPSNEHLQVGVITSNGTPADFALIGDIAQFNFKINQLSNKNKEEICIGDLIVGLDSPIKAVKTFTANLSLFNSDKPLLIGSPFVLFRNSCQVPARISKIIEIENLKKKRKHLVSKQKALVEIETDGTRLLPLSKFTDSKTLGRIVIRREGRTIGAGTVSDF